jgi:hypothetical protein
LVINILNLVIANKIIYFLSLFLLSANLLWAQHLATAKQLWDDKRIVAAKEAIDTYLDDAGREDAEGWLLKAAIYSAMSTDGQLKYLVADGRMDAFQAIKKATTINPGQVTAKLKTANFAILKDIYTGCTSDGVAFFNAGIEKRAVSDHGTALEYFKKALLVSQFAQQQGWKVGFKPNDSILLYNAAQAAIHAQKEDEALLHGKKLADKHIFTAGNYTKTDFENIYQWLVNYYHSRKDGSNLQLYAAKGAKIYPQSQYFTTSSINNYRETGSYAQMIAAYELGIKQFPNNDALLYSFCCDLFNYIHLPATTVKVKKLLYPKLEQNLRISIKSQPDSAQAYLLLGKHYFNMAADYQKSGASNNQVLLMLNQSISILKTCTEKDRNLQSQIRKQAFELLITALKSTGRKGEANEAYAKMQGTSQ